MIESLRRKSLNLYLVHMLLGRLRYGAFAVDPICPAL